MIRCKLHHLEQRCRERGTTLDAARLCIVAQDGDTITVDETHPAYPRPRPAPPQPPATRTDEPSLAREPGGSVPFLEKIKNFAVASAKHVAAGMPMASDAEILRRHDICLGCEFFKDDACTKCGCPVYRKRGYVSKLSWAVQSCPVGKWGKAAGA